MRSGVDELVAVGGSAAEEAALDRGLRGHRRADTGLDAGAFALAHPAVERHHEVVGLGAGIDRAADLGYPELDAEVREDRERQSELVAVERALRFTDHDGVEARGQGRGTHREAATPRVGASTATIVTGRCRRTRRRSRRRLVR